MAFEEVKARLVADPANRRQRLRYRSNTDPGNRKGRRSNLLFETNTERRGKILFNIREGVLGDLLGDPKAQAISGKVPL